MTLVKHSIPILEHDTEQVAVITPTRLNRSGLPERCVMAFSDAPAEYAKREKRSSISMFDTCMRSFDIYKTMRNGYEICFCEAPLGAPAAVALLDFLIAYGVKYIIATGACGTLVDLPENELLIPVRALRDEGTSYHYLPPARFIDLNKTAVEAITRTLKPRGLDFEECLTWTTDGFYRETREMVDYRTSEGCQVVEMECAALASCAAFRHVVFGQILYTGDTLVGENGHDNRGWGKSSAGIAFQLSMDAVLEI